MSLMRQRFSRGDFITLRRFSDEATRLIFLSSLPIFLVLVIYPSFVLSIFGREFPGNEPALYALLAGQFIVCFCGLSAQILNMAGRQNVLRNISIISAFVNVTGDSCDCVSEFGCEV